MRIEATIPSSRGEQLAELASELRVPRSAIVEEALSLLLTGLMEVRNGRRFALVDPESNTIISHVASPLLAQLEWTARREKIVLSRGEADRVEELLERPPKPTAALRSAMARHRKSRVK